MHHSPHAARWIDLAADLGYDLHMFPLDMDPPHQKLRNLTLHVPALDEPGIKPVKEVRRRGVKARAKNFMRLARSNPREAFGRLKSKIRRLIRMTAMRPVAAVMDVEPPRLDIRSSGVQIQPLPTYDTIGKVLDVTEIVRLGRADESDATALRIHGPDVLASLIRKLKPDLIHSMEFQHSAYLVLAARDRLEGKFPRWLATNCHNNRFTLSRLVTKLRLVTHLRTKLHFTTGLNCPPQTHQLKPRRIWNGSTTSKF